MHRDARGAGIGVFTIPDCKARGIVPVLVDALARIAHADAIMIDFDIHVIDRSQCPGDPGARPGGIPVAMCFAAARYLAAESRVHMSGITAFTPFSNIEKHRPNATSEKN